MSLSQQLAEYISACFTGLWVQSHEHQDALTAIAEVCCGHNWRLATWDIEHGLQLRGLNASTASDAAGIDPLAAIRSLNSLASNDSSAVLVLVNFHRFLNSAEIVQALARQLSTGKHNRTFIVVLSPVVQIPIELEKQFVVLEHELPDRAQLEEIARGIATDEGELPAGEELDRVLDAAAGLTRCEAESAFSLSLVRDHQIRPQAVWDLKCQTLKKSGLITLHQGSEKFSELGGLDALKSFCLQALRRSRDGNPHKRPRGTLLLGVPGTGKSAFCKALGSETGRPTLLMDMGALLGSLVGQSESNIRQALKLADAMSPCVLMIDEVEKTLAGVASSGTTDSGVTARLFGTFLSWLNDHDSDVFVVCSCNDISKLPPEFARAERFDGVFFLDLPGAAQKARIWEICLNLFDLDPDQPKPRTDDWTGAEIRACCRLAALLNVPLTEAARNVVPVAVTAAESVERLRNWASGRCLDADVAGIYQRHAIPAKAPRRRVSRDASVN